jgi:hypothetical protein
MTEPRMLTVADLAEPKRASVEELVRVLLTNEPTGEEPLMAVLEYALRALTTNRIVPVLVAAQEPHWVEGDFA